MAITSTISPTIPASGAAISSSTMRNQFVAAITDINSLGVAIDALEADTPVPAAFDLGLTYPSTPAASALLLGAFIVRSVAFAGHFVGSRFRAKTAPAAGFAVDVTKNGVTIGTITWTAGNPVAVLTTVAGAAQTAVDGDYIELIAPGTPDAAIAGIYGVLKGVRAN